MEESRELVRQAKKGKREAFAKLYETVYEDMYRFALYVLKDREDAEDAVAETVADAFESIGKLRKEEALDGSAKVPDELFAGKPVANVVKALAKKVIEKLGTEAESCKDKE